MQTPTRHMLAVVLAALTLLPGCGIHDPLNDLTNTRQPTAANSPNEVLGPPIDRDRLQPAAGAAPSPLAAVERFAARYVNWSYRTLAAVQLQLAAMSIGEASATHARAAAQIPADYELRHSRVVNRGRIVSIGLARPARPGRYVVVTLERTGGDDVYSELKPAYHVTLATVQHVHDGWAISRWEPQL